MRMIKKETFVALALLISTYQIPTYAQSCSTCNSDACLPCGAVITNAPSPAYEPPVAPYTNYMATQSCCKNPNNYFGGFYVGAGWGIGVVDWEFELANPGSPGAHNLVGLDSESRSYLVGIANAGFNLVFNYFSLGIEAGYNYRSRANPTSYYDVVDFQFLGDLVFPLEDSRAILAEPCKVRFDINSQHAVTLDILPGFVYKRFTVYLRLGVEKAQYDFQRRVCFPKVNITENVFVADVDDVEYIFSPPKRNETGYRVGLGFGIAACQNLSFHLNFVHTFSEKITYTPDVTAISANFPVIVGAPIGGVRLAEDSLSQLLSNITIEPQRNEVNLTMRWTF